MQLGITTGIFVLKNLNTHSVATHSCQSEKLRMMLACKLALSADNACKTHLLAVPVWGAVPLTPLLSSYSVLDPLAPNILMECLLEGVKDNCCLADKGKAVWRRNARLHAIQLTSRDKVFSQSIGRCCYCHASGCQGRERALGS